MIKKEDLKTFNLFRYLKEQNAHSQALPYFLSDQKIYREARVRFPFRTFAYGIGLTYSGRGGLFRIGSADYQLRAGCLTTVGPGVVAQWMGGYDAVHDTIYFTEDLFTDVLKASFLETMPFFLPGGRHVLALSADQIRKCKALLRSIRTCKDDPPAVAGLVYALVMLAAQCHRENGGGTPVSSSGRESLAGTFRKLVAEHFPEQKEVAFYASQLHVSPKYLSEILAAETGKPAKKLIDEHISMEAKSLLRQTAMSVQEICYWLGYEDTSYFTKTFRKWAGMTPLAYRKL